MSQAKHTPWPWQIVPSVEGQLRPKWYIEKAVDYVEPFYFTAARRSSAALRCLRPRRGDRATSRRHTLCSPGQMSRFLGFKTPSVVI